MKKNRGRPAADEKQTAVADAEGVEPVRGEEAAAEVLSHRRNYHAAEAETEEVSLDELFTLKPEILVAGATGRRRGEYLRAAAKDKKKKKKKYVEVVI